MPAESWLSAAVSCRPWTHPVHDRSTHFAKASVPIRRETVQNLGALCCRAEWSTGPPLGGGMVLGKGVVRNSGADLQHAMGASWGPTHLLVGAHPTVQQPLHRALRGRRRDRLVAALCRRIIDDQVRLPGDVGLEPAATPLPSRPSVPPPPCPQARSVSPR